MTGAWEAVACSTTIWYASGHIFCAFNRPIQPKKSFLLLPVRRLKLLERIGSGGAADVHRAIRRDSQTVIAVKILRHFSGDEAHMNDRFLREAELLCGVLRHQNVIRVFDYGTLPDGRSYMTLEYMPGGSLRKRMNGTGRQPMSEAMARSTGSQVADALAYAHSCRVIHRDLKPENVLFDANGSLKLGDFGIAYTSDSRMTGSGPQMGTPHYMAPEQIRAEIEDAPHPSWDLYALGCFLYEIAAGRCPFEGRPEQVINAHLHDAPPKLREFNAKISPEYETLCLSLLDKEPHRRPPTADGVASALRAAAFSGQSAASPIAQEPASQKAQHTIVR